MVNRRVVEARSTRGDAIKATYRIADERVSLPSANRSSSPTSGIGDEAGIGARQEAGRASADWVSVVVNCAASMGCRRFLSVDDRSRSAGHLLNPRNSLAVFETGGRCMMCTNTTPRRRPQGSSCPAEPLQAAGRRMACVRQSDAATVHDTSSSKKMSEVNVTTLPTASSRTGDMSLEPLGAC